MDTPLLAIYLNDHFAGSAGGVELARRLAKSNADDQRFGPVLATICAEVETDRELLERAMAALGVDRNRVKPVAARIGERLGRLKLNGRLRGYSPLSRLLEIEMLELGVTGKRQLWRALRDQRGDRVGDVDLQALEERADAQIARLEDLHALASRLAFD